MEAREPARAADAVTAGGWTRAPRLPGAVREPDDVGHRPDRSRTVRRVHAPGYSGAPEGDNRIDLADTRSVGTGSGEEQAFNEAVFGDPSRRARTDAPALDADGPHIRTEPCGVRGPPFGASPAEPRLAPELLGGGCRSGASGAGSRVARLPTRSSNGRRTINVASSPAPGRPSARAPGRPRGAPGAGVGRFRAGQVPDFPQARRERPRGSERGQPEQAGHVRPRTPWIRSVTAV